MAGRPYRYATVWEKWSVSGRCTDSFPTTSHIDEARGLNSERLRGRNDPLGQGGVARGLNTELHKRTRRERDQRLHCAAAIA